MTLLTDVAWPASWKRAPLWSMFQRIKDVGHPDEQMLSVYRDLGVVRKDDQLDNYNKTALNREIYQLIDDGWLALNRMKAWQGAVGISTLRGIVSGHYICFRPAHRAEPRFLHYLIRSPVYTAEMQRISRGVRPSQIEVDNDQLRVLGLWLPCLEEQRRIADFLDVETARIDALIAAKTRTITCLMERADALIGREIAGSELVRADGAAASEIKHQLRKLARPAPPSAPTITAYRDGQVTARTLRRTEGYTDSWTEGASRQGVRAGDVVVHGLDGFSGAIGAAEVDGACSPVNHVCEPVDGDPDFLGRLLRILATTGYLELFAISTRERAVDFRNWERFGSHPDTSR